MVLPSRLVLLGHPVGHSLSPLFQSAALAAAGIALRYDAIDVAPDDLPATFEALIAEGAAGNVTIPHKVTIARLCREFTVQADRVGAVNAFKVRDGHAVGHNTDVEGFDAVTTVLLGRRPRNQVIGIFGAGGAAAAVLAAIENWPGCLAIVANRDMDRAGGLCERFRSVARSGDADEIARRADIVVNATSLGMSGESGPIDPTRLRRAVAVVDLVYSREETRFVLDARAHGIRAADGLPMLIAQGAAAFTWWLDHVPDLEVMWRAVGRTPLPIG